MKPLYQPKYRKKPTVHEEEKLRKLDAVIDAYLTFAMPKSGQPRHRFVRELYRLYASSAPAVFIQAVARAYKYRITSLQTLENIIVLKLKSTCQASFLPDIDPELQKRQAYIEGCFTDEVDLTIYDQEDDDG